ncbi:MAG: hypothetical protein KBS41_00920 [Oscillospiraceae bacterium]|nr:hypothetical protein [Candidatus Equicaccousia limihippi]
MKFDRRALKALEILDKNGYSAYLVGGCVRDYLLGKAPGDYDIAVTCSPSGIKKAFAEYKQILTGEAYGTVTVVIEGLPLEITSCRSEDGYNDSRHPSSVDFSADIRGDLSRRDFTVNAIACDRYMNFTDPHGGENDLKNGIIRAVGEPQKRFGEDALRILRGVRFCSVLGFEIENGTAQAMLKMKDGLNAVSRERVSAEIKKAAVGKNFGKALTLYGEIFSAAYKGFENFDINTVQAINRADKDLKDFAFLCGFENTQTAAKDLFYQKATVNKADFFKNNLLINHGNMRGFLKDANYEDMRLLLRLKDAFNIESTDEKSQFEYIVQNRLCCKIGELAVSGNDIQMLGYSGEAVGKMLEKALWLVTTKGIKNDKQTILSYLKKA